MPKTADKIIIYIDMDDTLCDYRSAFIKAMKESPEIQYPQSILGFFINLLPIIDAISTYQWLASQPLFDVYILTAPSPKNPHSYTEKRLWVEQYLGYDAVERLIISPHKHLNQGDYLIDDKSEGRGQDLFKGKLIHFSHEPFNNWLLVKKYFEDIAQQDSFK